MYKASGLYYQGFLGQRSPRIMKVFTKNQGHRSRNGEEMFESAYAKVIITPYTLSIHVFVLSYLFYKCCMQEEKNQVCHPLGAFDIDVSLSLSLILHSDIETSDSATVMYA